MRSLFTAGIARRTITALSLSALMVGGVGAIAATPAHAHAPGVNAITPYKYTTSLYTPNTVGYAVGTVRHDYNRYVTITCYSQIRVNQWWGGHLWGNVTSDSSSGFGYAKAEAIFTPKAGAYYRTHCTGWASSSHGTSKSTSGSIRLL